VWFRVLLSLLSLRDLVAWIDPGLAWRNRNHHHLRWFNVPLGRIAGSLFCWAQWFNNLARTESLLLVAVFCKKWKMNVWSRAGSDWPGRDQEADADATVQFVPRSRRRPSESASQGDVNVRTRRGRRMNFEEHCKRKCWTLELEMGLWEESHGGLVLSFC